MKISQFDLSKLFILLISLYFVKTSPLHINIDDTQEEVVLVMDDILISPGDMMDRISTYEQNVLIMQGKVKSLSENFNQLEHKVVSLANDKINSLDENIRKMMEKVIEEKINRVDQIIQEKITQINDEKPSYNVHELKCANNRLPTSCHELSECSSNIYNIMVPQYSNESFPGVCDLINADGGWTVIQRRQDGSENFYRNWTEYVEGFGNMNGEFFIGLEKLHALTTLGEPQELYIILEDFEGERKYARYGKFQVGSKDTDYKLIVGEYSGNAGDCFTQHSGYKFSTKDRDNDVNPRKNCAAHCKGAWWYTGCYYSNLNGLYLSGKMPGSKSGLTWCKFRGPDYSLKFVKMMIRPKRD